MASDNVIDYPLMARQREEQIQQGELARADDVNAEFNSIIDVYNRLVGLLQGEWGGDTGRIYELVDEAVRVANEALTKAEGAVLRTGDTMAGQLNQPEVPVSDYNLVNKKYVDTKIQDDLASPINRISTLEDRLDNLKATQVKLDNDNFTGKNVNDGMNELFISVSNGKNIIAAAVTDKGVPTSGDDSFKQIRDNIMSIVTFNEGASGGTATPEDVMKGKTFFARQSYFTGTYVPLDTDDATANEDDITLGKTAYARGQKLYGTGTSSYIPGPPVIGVDTSDATATARDIVQGKVAYSRGARIVGVLSNTNAEVTEIKAVDYDAKYKNNNINGYQNQSMNPAPPEGSVIELTGIVAISKGTIYGLSPNQCRIIDAIRIKKDNKYNRYIRVRLMDENGIVSRVSGSTGLPVEKTMYSYSELGLNPDYDITDISIGTDFFQSRQSHRGVAIHQEIPGEHSLHIYDYNAADNWLGKDPNIEEDYIYHWDVPFTISDVNSSATDQTIKGSLAGAPRWTNNRPNVCCVAVTFNRNISLCLLDVATITVKGVEEGVVYKDYSFGRLPVAIRHLQFSVNDRYVYGNGKLISSGFNSYVLGVIDTTSYTFNTIPTIGDYAFGGICVFDNETKCLLDGKVYNLGILNNNINMTPVDNSGIFPKGGAIYVPTIDNKYLIVGEIVDVGLLERNGAKYSIYELAANVSSGATVQAVQSFTSTETVPSLGFNNDGLEGFFASDKNLNRFIIGLKDDEIVAIRYKEKYWYQVNPGALTAGQGDVVKGKTFIGYMGYLETGIKE